MALDFPIIYTTNYDRNLEVAFEIHGRAFVKVANARDVARVRRDVTQIVKYHGDFDDDTSLVLTETDYFDRLSFDSPLDVKFRADALGRTILFVGYSLSDMNIRLLLHRLWQAWQRSGYEADRPPSFVFMASRNPVEEAVLAHWGITVLSQAADDPEQALTAFLENLAALIGVEDAAHGTAYGRGHTDRSRKTPDEQGTGDRRPRSARAQALAGQPDRGRTG